MKIDNYALSLFRHCPKEYFWRIVKQLAPKGVSPALSFGLAIHEALAKTSISDALLAFNKSFGECSGDEKRNTNVGEALVRGYFSRYGRTEGTIFLPFGLRVLESEISFSITIGPALYEGRIDKIVEVDGKAFILEHKTTSYLQGICANPHPQLEGYMVASQFLLGGDTTGYGILDLSLVTKTLSKYTDGSAFARIVTTRNKDQLSRWLCETKQLLQLILNCQEKDCWPKSGDCFRFFTPCSYLSLCQDESNWERIVSDLDLYTISEWSPHSER